MARRNLDQRPRPARQTEHGASHRQGIKAHPIVRCIKDGDIWGTDRRLRRPPARLFGERNLSVMGHCLRAWPLDNGRGESKTTPLCRIAWIKDLAPGGRRQHRRSRSITRPLGPPSMFQKLGASPAAGQRLPTVRWGLMTSNSATSKVYIVGDGTPLLFLAPTGLH